MAGEYHTLTNTAASRVARYASLSSDNPNDSWGSANLTAYGAVGYVTPPVGKGLGKAFSVDGDATGIYLGQPVVTSLSGATKATFAAWLYPIVYANTGVAISLRRDTTAAIFLGWGSSYGDVRFFVSDSSYVLKAGALPLNAWTHVAGVYDGTLAPSQRLKLYVNGVLQAGTVTGVDAPASLPVSSTSKVVIGRHDSALGSYGFTGAVYDSRIYSDALTATDLAELTAGPEPTNTVAPTLAANGDWTAGTWDAWGNGSLTYTVILKRNGTTVATLQAASATSSGNAASQFATYGSGMYTIEVTAINAGGDSVAVTSSGVVYTASAAPEVVTNPTLATTGAWTVGTWDTNGGGTLSYTVTLEQDGSEVATLQTDSATTSGNAASQMSANGPGDYTVVVVAHNDEGDSDPAESSAATHTYYIPVASTVPTFSPNPPIAGRAVTVTPATWNTSALSQRWYHYLDGTTHAVTTTPSTVLPTDSAGKDYFVDEIVETADEVEATATSATVEVVSATGETGVPIQFISRPRGHFRSRSRVR